MELTYKQKGIEMEMMKRSQVELICRTMQANMKANEFFGMKFVKKDGSDRTMNCRFHVKKHLKGGTRSWSEEDYPHLMCVFDVNAKPVPGYRTVNLNTVYEICVKHRRFEVVD